MTDVLARRYRVVLHAYPRSYRSRRGDELLDTLLEFAAPEQRWPSLREATSLLVEGIRTRFDAGRSRPPRAMWIDGLQVTVVLLLANASAPLLSDVVRQQLSAGVGIALFLLALVTTVTALGGRWVVTLALAVAWLAAQVFLFTISWQHFPISWHLLAAVLLLVVPAAWLRSERPARSIWWLLAVPAAMLLRSGLELFTFPVSYLYLQVVVALVAVAGVTGALLDPRAPIVAAGLLAVENLRATVELPTPGDTQHSGVIVLLPSDALLATVEWTAPNTSTGVVFFVHPTWSTLVLVFGSALLFLAGHLRVRHRNRL